MGAGGCSFACLSSWRVIGVAFECVRLHGQRDVIGVSITGVILFFIYFVLVLL